MIQRLRYPAEVASVHSGPEASGGISVPGGAPAPPFNPMTLTPSSWIKGSYGGLPWNYVTLPLAPTVPSREKTRGSGSCVDPVAGRVVDGITSARYNSTGGFNASSLTDSGNTVVFTDDFLTNGSWSPGFPLDYTIMGLVYVDSAPAYNAGLPYANPTIMQCDARWGCSFSSAGVGIYYYNGSTFPNRQEAWTIAQWNFFCVRFGGALGVQRRDLEQLRSHGAADPRSCVQQCRAG